MRLSSTFDILGPIMVGPSSSHTAGALRIAQLAASLCHAPVVRVRFTLFNSFAQTFHGHGTDRALLAGILGMHTDDPRIRDSFDFARERGISWEFAIGDGDGADHPNTVDIDLLCADGATTSVRGESVGGGRIRIARINGVKVDISGRMPTTVVAHRDLPGMLARMTTVLGNEGVNIAYMSSYRTSPGKTAYAVFETDTAIPDATVARIAAQDGVLDAYSVRIPGVLTIPEDVHSPYDFDSGAHLVSLAEQHDVSLGRIMRLREFDLRGEQSTRESMHAVLTTMRDEVDGPLAKPLPSLGGLIGGEARRAHASGGTPLDICGPVLTDAMAYAMAVLERSATMGVIVAAPTAGSSGVVPGCLLALQRRRDLSDEAIEEALFCAAAVGALIERGASVSGAEGGCQAEVGSASAMAAAAIAQLMGATPNQVLTAASIAIANLLGLVCDPVRGLVETPCQIRNAVGVANALTAAQLSCAGVGFALPFDEVVQAMRSVGRALPMELRETALGGLAACPSAQGVDCENCTTYRA